MCWTSSTNDVFKKHFPKILTENKLEVTEDCINQSSSGKEELNLSTLKQLNLIFSDLDNEGTNMKLPGYKNKLFLVELVPICPPTQDNFHKVCKSQVRVQKGCCKETTCSMAGIKFFLRTFCIPLKWTISSLLKCSSSVLVVYRGHFLF